MVISADSIMELTSKVVGGGKAVGAGIAELDIGAIVFIERPGVVGEIETPHRVILAAEIAPPESQGQIAAGVGNTAVDQGVGAGPLLVTVGEVETVLAVELQASSEVRQHLPLRRQIELVAGGVSLIPTRLVHQAILAEDVKIPD